MTIWQTVEHQLGLAYVAGHAGVEFDMLAARDAVMAAVHTEFPRSRDDQARDTNERG